MGIEATLLENPKDTLASVPPHIPWDHSTCALTSPLLVLPQDDGVRRSDALTEHNLVHSRMFEGIVFHNNTRCTHLYRQHNLVPSLQQYVAWLPLREAMAVCAEMEQACTGVDIQWSLTNVSRRLDEQAAARLPLSFCHKTTTKADDARTTLLKHLIRN